MKRNDEARQKILIEEFKTKTLPSFLDVMQKVLEDNGGNYLVGSAVSLNLTNTRFIFKNYSLKVMTETMIF